MLNIDLIHIKIAPNIDLIYIEIALNIDLIYIENLEKSRLDKYLGSLPNF